MNLRRKKEMIRSQSFYAQSMKYTYLLPDTCDHKPCPKTCIKSIACFLSDDTSCQIYRTFYQEIPHAKTVLKDLHIDSTSWSLSNGRSVRISRHPITWKHPGQITNKFWRGFSGDNELVYFSSAVSPEGVPNATGTVTHTSQNSVYPLRQAKWTNNNIILRKDQLLKVDADQFIEQGGCLFELLKETDLLAIGFYKGNRVTFKNCQEFWDLHTFDLRIRVRSIFVNPKRFREFRQFLDDQNTTMTMI
jgi:hypothetical protein